VAVVAAGDQITVWDDQETAANHYLACTGANVDAEIRVMTPAPWERVRAELVGQQTGLGITEEAWSPMTGRQGDRARLLHTDEWSRPALPTPAAAPTTTGPSTRND
jgi:hypothetical protein